MTPLWVRFLPWFARRPLEGRGYLQRVIVSAGWLLAERVLRYTVGFLVGIWVARYVGPEQYGLLNYSLAFVTVFAYMSTLGLDSLAVREMVRDRGVRDEMLGTLVTMRLVGGVMMLVAVAIGMTLLRPADPRAAALIALISLAHVVQAFDVIDCWFQSALMSRFAFGAKATAVLTVAVVRIILITAHAPLIAFAWAILAESTLLAAGMLVAYKWSGAPLDALRPRMARAKALVREGWPLMLLALVAAIYLRIDQVMLGQLAGFAEVGAYAVAARVVEVCYVIPAVLMAAVFPAMVKSKEGDVGQYEARLQRLFDAMLWLAVIIAVPLSLLAPVVIDTLLSSAYAEAGPVLAILAWMPVWVFFSMARQRWLFAENAFRAAMAVEIVGCGLNISRQPCVDTALWCGRRSVGCSDGRGRFDTFAGPFHTEHPAERPYVPDSYDGATTHAQVQATLSVADFP